MLLIKYFIGNTSLVRESYHINMDTNSLSENSVNCDFVVFSLSMHLSCEASMRVTPR